MKAALALLYLFRGTPCILYGTEILIWGGYDPDCRRCMNWEVTGSNGEYVDVWKLLRGLSKLRKEYELADGIQKLYAKEEMFCLENKTKQGTIKLSINMGSKEADDVPAKSFLVSVDGGVVFHG